ncbi:MAG TPA: glycosyltransferase [Symbiobacteriaceae bacterium]|nr:glycosyltransferase [Symbiobacteriaceae bacterium]
MNRFWDPVIRPVLERVMPKSIVEVGCDRGHHTREILAFCRATDAVLHAVDPAPRFDVPTLTEEFGEHFRFYRATSLQALPLVERFDVVLLDGDHNWYTVYHELQLLRERCETLGQPFPLVFLHDLGWPYGRRDLYYNPESIPAAYRNPFLKQGMEPDSTELLPEGGLNSGFCNAMTEGGPRNGVLTAVEDFLKEHGQGLRSLAIPGLHGLGIICNEQLLARNSALAGFLQQFRLSPEVLAYIDRIERSRIQAEITRVERDVTLKQRTDQLRKMEEQLRAKDAERQDHDTRRDELRQELEHSVAIIQQMKETESVLRQEAQELHSAWANEFQRLETMIAAREREIGHLQALVQNMQEKVDLQQTLLGEERQRRAGDVAAREREIGYLKNLLQNESADHERELLQFQAERAQLEDGIAAGQSEIEDLHRRLNQAEEEMAGLRAASKADLNRLEAQLASARAEASHLSSKLTASDGALAKERAESAERNKEFGRLEKRLREANREVTSLRSKISGLQTAMQTVYSSTSWRITAPIRWAGSVLRRQPRKHQLDVVPVKDVSTENQGYRSTGRDPQFKLVPANNRFLSGWVLLKYSAVAEDCLLSPVLYVDCGRGYTEAQAFRLPHHGTGRFARLLRLPEQVKALRFDPMSCEAHFGLSRVSMRPIGKVELLLRLLWNRLRPVGSQPREWARLLGAALSLLRRGDADEIKRRLVEATDEQAPSRHPAAPASAPIDVSNAPAQEWHLTPPQPISPYKAWQEVNAWTDKSLKHLESRLSSLKNPPVVSVILTAADSSARHTEASVLSVLSQVYCNWDLYVVVPDELSAEVQHSVEKLVGADPRVHVVTGKDATIPQSVNTAAGQSTGTLLAFMDSLDRLTPDALGEMVLAMHEHQGAQILYADEDRGEPGKGQSMPVFRPGWSPELLLAQNFCGSFLVVDRQLFTDVNGVREGFGSACQHDLVLRAGERTSKVVHVPLVLNHRVSQSPNRLTEEMATDSRLAVEAALARRGVSAQVVQQGQRALAIEFRDDGPAVSVVVALPEPADIGALLESLGTTTYQNYELVVVSHSPALLAAFSSRERVGTLHVPCHPGMEQNRASLYNAAAQYSRAEYVAFLREGVQITDPRWLSRMVGYASFSGVGAVGIPAADSLPAVQTAAVTNCATVSEHCMLTSREAFMSAGGFDAEQFPESYFAQDYGYRLVDRGLRCVASLGVEPAPVASGQHIGSPAAAALFRQKYHKRMNLLVSPYVGESGQVVPRKLALGRLAPIRTMVFSHNLNPTEGAPNSLFEAVVALKEQGVLDPVVFSPSEGLLRRSYEEIGIRVFVGQNPAKDGRDPAAFEKAMAKLTALMQSLDIEMVHANTLQTFYGIVAAERLQLPAVWNPRESEPWHTYFDFLAPQVRRLAYACFAYAYRVVFVAEATRENWAPLESTHNFTVVHNGLNLQRLREQASHWSRESARAALGLRDDEIMVLLPGTVTKRKGQEDLILALQHLPPAAVKRVRCFLVGGRPTPYSKGIEAMVAALPEAWRGRVTVVPETPEIAQYYAAADVFICTSRVESFPRVILEGMAYGLPIVSTPVFGIREQVWEGVNGWFYEPERPLELAERLASLIMDDERRREMGAQSVHVLGTLNDYRDMVEQYARVLREAYLSKGKPVALPAGRTETSTNSGIDLSIITISRNLGNLDKLFGSIQTSLHHLNIEVLLAWNGKEDVESVRQRYPNLPMRVFEIRPYNFARNNNELFRHSSGACCLFINDDIELDGDALQRSWNQLHRPGVGLVGANLRYPNGMIQHAGVLFRPDGRPYHRFKHELPYNDPAISETCSVPAVTGAFMLMQSADFALLLFDESFRVAGEDIDLCLRFRQVVGKDIVYVADATATHYEGVTRKTTGERLTPPEDMCKIVASWHRAYGSTHPSVEIVSSPAPKIRIVTEKPGWILHRKALEIQRHLPNVRINEDWDDADIHYYINYGFYNRRPRNGIVVANFTHYDPDKLADKFIATAKEVDHCTAVSLQTVDDLKRFGIPDDKISLIVVGADVAFRPKMTVGIVGRIYPGGRKGEHLVQALLENERVMDGLQIVASHEGWGVPVWKFDQMADFYRSIDYLLVPSLIEGGPVPFMEALACGTLAIAPPIGVIPMFPHIEYPTGDAATLMTVLNQVKQDFFESKGHARTIHAFDWTAWANAHRDVFRMLMEKSVRR